RPPPRRGRRRRARRRRRNGSAASPPPAVHLPADERGDLELVHLRWERGRLGGRRPTSRLLGLHVAPPDSHSGRRPPWPRRPFPEREAAGRSPRPPLPARRLTGP